MSTLTPSIIEQIAGKIREHRSHLMDELRIHDAVEGVLQSTGIEYVREHPLSGRLRLDFWLPHSSTAIEVKRGNFRSAYLHQIARYLDESSVQAIILIALRIDHDIPTVLREKPVHHLELWRYLL